MRKLASIRKISELSPIPNADKIEVAKVDGWECVVKKGEFKVGDKIVYIEVDSILPETSWSEFLRDRKFRVKTIKLRGQISQGLVLPLDVLPKGKFYMENDDVTNILGIKKYDPEAEAERKETQSVKPSKNPIVKYLMRYRWFRRLRRNKELNKQYPSFISKTDEERIQNLTNMFNKEKENGTLFDVTEKVDGSSSTFYLKKNGIKKHFGVCSRNYEVPDNGNVYWKIARQYDIKNVLNKIIGCNDIVIIRGEIYGEGVQGNKYHVEGHRLAVFDLYFIRNGDIIKTRTKDIASLLNSYGMQTVPIVEQEVKLKDSVHDMVEYSKGKSVLWNRNREGIVVRSIDNRVSFKVINPEFLLE